MFIVTEFINKIDQLGYLYRILHPKPDPKYDPEIGYANLPIFFSKTVPSRLTKVFGAGHP